MQGSSGICKYSKDFYDNVLKDQGYIFMDSAESLIDILSAISSKDHIHIELGIFQEKEIEILFTMLKANYRNISVTLHDPPLLRFPYYRFSNPFLNKIAKFYDIYINHFRASRPWLNKIKYIYVLSLAGQQLLREKYKIAHAHYLPHIVDPKEIEKGRVTNRNFIFFGFIGRNKGIEYALRLHQQLLVEQPGSHFYIIGEALGREKEFFAYLQAKYQKNVHYFGYVEEGALQEVFRQAGCALLLFRDYKFFQPFSGSILYSLKLGKITFTNKVNAIPEIIKSGKTGFFLTGNLKKDLVMIKEVFQDPALLESMQKEIQNYLLSHHSPAEVRKHLKTDMYAVLNPDRQLQ